MDARWRPATQPSVRFVRRSTSSSRARAPRAGRARGTRRATRRRCCARTSARSPWARSRGSGRAGSERLEMTTCTDRAHARRRAPSSRRRSGSGACASPRGRSRDRRRIRELLEQERNGDRRERASPRRERVGRALPDARVNHVQRDDELVPEPDRSASPSSSESQAKGIESRPRRPLGEQRRLPVAGRRADQGQPQTASVAQPVDQALPRHEARSHPRRLKLGLEDEPAWRRPCRLTARGRPD